MANWNHFKTGWSNCFLREHLENNCCIVEEGPLIKDLSMLPSKGAKRKCCEKTQLS